MSVTREKPPWFPKLLKPWSYDRLSIPVLEECVKEGSFVPFLGAGASSMRPKDKEERENKRLHEGPWVSVCCNLSKLRRVLGEKGEQKEKTFLEYFAEEYNCDCKSASSEATDGQRYHALFHFQLALIRLVTGLTEVFGKCMADGCICISSFQDLAARNLMDMKLEKKLKDAIVESLAAAHALKCEGSELFDADNVWRKLVHFAYAHADQPTWAEICEQVNKISLGASLDETVKMITDRQFEFYERGSRLAISEIAWLTQLLWYSLTFQVPAYPTTSELAFRLSLFSKNVPPRVGELAQAAETVADYKDLLDQVKNLFRFCHKHMEKPFGPLHKGIAGALIFAFEKREREKARRRLPPPITMALTTNFDMALESAFENLKASYHVVFPIFDSDASVAALPDGKNQERSTFPATFPTIVWVIKTVTFFEGGERSVDWTPWNQRDNEGLRDKEFNPEGPVIVKLHGSPLEAIPENKLPEYRDYCSCIVLPESTYLEMILQQDSPFPGWISRALRTPKSQEVRSLWFLGYSISDWNIRLWLYQQLHWIFDDPENAPNLFAVNHGFDLYQSAVFGRLRVVGKEGDLRGVARALLDMKELACYIGGRKA